MEGHDLSAVRSSYVPYEKARDRSPVREEKQQPFAPGARVLVMNGAGSSNSKHDAAGVWHAATLPPHIALAAKALRKHQFCFIHAGVPR
jgi:hypothetical protein